MLSYGLEFPVYLSGPASSIYSGPSANITLALGLKQLALASSLGLTKSREDILLPANDVMKV